MNNLDAEQNINSCLEELQRIEMLIENVLGHTSPIIPYLTKYAIVRACGTVEYCFKAIVSDALSGHSLQISNYIDNTIRFSSMNPNRDNISNVLKKFDVEWNANFKSQLNNHEHSERLKSSLASLNTARNSFAHGNTPSSTFADVRAYFDDSVEIIKLIDAVLGP